MPINRCYDSCPPTAGRPCLRVALPTRTERRCTILRLCCKAWTKRCSSIFDTSDDDIISFVGYFRPAGENNLQSKESIEYSFFTLRVKKEYSRQKIGICSLLPTWM